MCENVKIRKNGGKKQANLEILMRFTDFADCIKNRDDTVKQRYVPKKEWNRMILAA